MTAFPLPIGDFVIAYRENKLTFPRGDKRLLKDLKLALGIGNWKC